MTLSMELEGATDAFSVRQCSVHERLSTPFDIEVIALCSNADVDIAALSGARATVELHGASGSGGEAAAHRYHGVCLLAEQLESEGTGLSTYVFHIGPRLSLLGYRSNHRVFQHQNVRQIVTTLLDEWGVEHRWRIDPDAHPPFEYRVQYGETDLSFVERLLESAGITYTFEHDADLTRVVLDDAPLSRQARTPPLPWVAHGAERTREAQVSDVRVATRLRSGRHRIRDVDFRRATRYVLAAETQAGSELEQRLEVYGYHPGAFTTEGHPAGDTRVADDLGVARSDERHGARLARIGLEQHRASRRTVSFSTTAVDLRAGTVFTLEGHPRSDLGADQQLLVTELAILGSFDHPLHITGQAVFGSEPYRPPAETRAPRIHGIESAVVVGPAGDEIYTDEHGRVRVQFHWDRHGGHDERSSCWLRVSQGWAGGGFGMMAIPRVGQEVLVSFLGGNPDQPVVVGRLYNATSRVPYALPDNETVSCWRSRSTPNSEGFNELRFEDKAGSEQIYLHAERDLDEEVGHDHGLRVRRNERVRVGGAQSVSVGGKRTESIGHGDELVVRHGDKTVEVADGDTVVTCENGKIELQNGIAFVRMLRDKIELHTGRGAAITLEGDRIILAANTIELSAVSDVRVESSRTVHVDATSETDIRGGIIKLNC